MNFRDLVAVVWKWRVLTLVVVVLSGAFGAFFAAQRAPTYESTATIAITPDIKSQGLVSADALSALLGTYAETAKSDVVRNSAEDILGHKLAGTVSSSTEAGTGILRITDRAHDAVEARDTAAAVSSAFVNRLKGNPNLSANLVSPASVPDSPVQPRPPLIIATSLVVGLGVAILLAIAIDRLRRRVMNSEDLAEITPLPLLGQIERTRTLLRSRPKIIWNGSQPTTIQENFRSLRTNVQLTTGADGIALEVTSAGPSQGKSTVTANLGIAFADLGIPTAIVDADLRRPAQHDIFEIKNEEASWTRRNWGGGKSGGKTRFPNLAVFTAGAPKTDPTELLQVRLPVLLERLRQSYDLVLVDTPPILAVSDARITAGWMDGVLIVLAAGDERPSALSHALAQLALANVKVEGFVINKAASTGEGSYYYRSAGAGAPSGEGKPNFLTRVRG